LSFVRPSSATCRRILFGLTLAAACGAMAYAQGPGGGMRGGMPGGRGMGIPDSMPRGGGPAIGGPGSNGGPRGGMRGGSRGVPRGRWWDDRKVAKSLGLNDDQRQRMDSVFSQNRDALMSRYENLQKAQTQLDAVKNSDHPSDSALFTEIDHVAQARADLEKTYTRMMLQIRGEMTPEQINKLEDVR
jgi:Spy/CpxP family protein refolding chaperone